MRPSELIEELMSVGLPPETARLSVRLIFRVVRDRIYEFRLENGSHMHDTMDVRDFFGQVVEALTPPAARIPSAPATTCRSLTTGGVQRVEWPKEGQPRWSKDDPCPACSHVHIGVLECAVDMGGGGKCDCRLKVPA